MKKFFLSATVIALFLGYVGFERHNRAPVITPPASLKNIPISQLPGNTAQVAYSTTPPATEPPKSATASSSQASSSSQSSSSSNSSSASSQSSNSQQASTPSTPPAPQGQYKDGQYTGDSVDAYYGYVQVKAIIQGGKLTDVQFLSYPNDRGYSRMVNSQATPYLAAEAVQAQSANVDAISGATETSGAFVQSLASALAQAKN